MTDNTNLNNGIRSENAISKIKVVIDNYGFTNKKEADVLMQIADAFVTAQYSAAAKHWKVFPDLLNIVITLTKMELTFSHNNALMAAVITRPVGDEWDSVALSYRIIGPALGEDANFTHAVNFNGALQVQIVSGRPSITPLNGALPYEAIKCMSEDFVDDDITHAYSVTQIEQSLLETEFVLGISDVRKQYSDSTVILGIRNAPNKLMARILRVVNAMGFELEPTRWIIVHSD